MYESPIKLITDRVMKDFVKEQDAYILQEVVRLGVDIDKEELMRALKYDREQYEAGYADGKRDAVVHGRWYWHEGGWWQCSECACSPADWESDPDNEYGLPPFCHACGAKNDPEVE